MCACLCEHIYIVNSTIKMVDEHVPRKIGGRNIIHSQARELICNIYAFMKLEADQGPILLQKVQERVAQATGVSRRSVQRILGESKTNVEVGQGFSTPRKKRPRKKSKTEIDDFDKCVVRRTIVEFHRTEGQRPVLKALLPVMQEKIDFKGRVWALRKIIRELGFRWKKSTDNRKILIEKHDIREKRVNYIKAIQQYRKEGRPIVYMDETYVHASHTHPHSWTDGTNSGLLSPISKGKYAIIVHAGNENGFIDNALLVFKSGQKSGDYHDCMNFNNYKRWLKDQLIPNLPEKSVLVIDNASYHNVQLNPSPTSNTKKADMIRWLIRNDVQCNEKMLKPELYQLIKLNKSRTKMYEIDAILAEHDHSALRLPPYHPDLNPIEMIWSTIKNYVALKNTTFVLNDCINLVKESANLITKEEWSSRCQHVRAVEDNYLINEPAIDEMSDRIVVNLGDDSSGSDSSEDDNEEGSDGGMSGVESL